MNSEVAGAGPIRRAASGAMRLQSEGESEMSDAMRSLTQAAREGDANAQFNLGVLCDSRTDDNGYVVEGNRAEAVKWLLAAAQQGLPRAQIMLAGMYVDRPDSHGSHADACFWLLLAKGSLAGAHRERAQSAYDRVAAGLSPAQIAAATKRTRLWKQAGPARAAPGRRRKAGGDRRTPSTASELKQLGASAKRKAD